MNYFHNKNISLNAPSSSVFFPSESISFMYGDNALIRFSIFQDDSVTPFDLTGYTFKFGLDYTFLSGNTDLVIADNTQFIAGDWSDYSLANGRICCRVNFKTQALLDYLGESSQLSTIASLWAIGTPNILLAQFPCITKNRISVVA